MDRWPPVLSPALLLSLLPAAVEEQLMRQLHGSGGEGAPAQNPHLLVRAGLLGGQLVTMESLIVLLAPPPDCSDQARPECRDQTTLTQSLYSRALSDWL